MPAIESINSMNAGYRGKSRGYNPEAMPLRAVLRRALLPVLLSAVVVGAVHGLAQSGAQTFAARIQQLSEEGGDFDTDNLISNERSYLEVVPALKAGNVSGGAYIGVGP